MDKFFLMIIISYFGLNIGAIISQMAKEELSSGKKYFKILKALLFSLVIGTFLFHLGLSWFSIIISLIFFILSCLAESKVKLSLDLFYYTLFAVILYELREKTLSILVATAIFLFPI